MLISLLTLVTSACDLSAPLLDSAAPADATATAERDETDADGTEADATTSRAGGETPGADDGSADAPADATADADADAEAGAPAPEESEDAADQQGATTTVSSGSSDSVWISEAEVRRLPTSGTAWAHVKRRADEATGSADLGETNRHAANVLARAMVGARLDDDRYRAAVRDELMRVRDSDDRRMSILRPARKMASYVAAADLIDLASFDPAADRRFRDWISGMRTRVYDGGGDPAHSLVSAHEQRPNNFGTAAGAARIAISAYLGHDADVERAAQVFRGWLGDRSAYSDFNFGALQWQADRKRPVGINPAGARIMINGQWRDVSGVLPDEQRRQGPGLTWPPKQEGYVYAGLSGAVAQAELLTRQGYRPWSWSNNALHRAIDWLHSPIFGGGALHTATGTPNEWVVPVLNRRYGTSYPWTPGFWRGSIMSYSDWTHGT